MLTQIAPYPLSPITGEHGEVDPGIVAAGYVTLSGTTPTLVHQKNVASITRNATGRYRVAFTSNLADTDYGVLVYSRRKTSTASTVSRGGPSRNSTSGWNTYAVDTLDLDFLDQGSSSAHDPDEFGFIVFDPDNIDAVNYLAAALWTVSGTTLTDVKSPRCSMSRLSTGVYRMAFTSSPADNNYQLFGHSRAATFTNATNFTFGANRNPTLPSNSYSTSQIDIIAGNNGGATTAFDCVKGGLLVKKTGVAPRGTVASVRFSYISSVLTIIDQWNVASVSRTSAGLFVVNFNEPIDAADYSLFGTGKFADFANDTCPVIGIGNNSSLPFNTKSTTACSVSIGSPASTTMNDAEYVNLWFVKPWLM